METRHILLTACSFTPGVERWLASSSALTERFKPVIAMYRDHFSAPSHCQVLKIDQPWPGKALRLVHMANVIKHLGTDRWYIWSDCADVVFQRLPVLFDSIGPEIRGFACSEGMRVDENEKLIPFLINPRFEHIKKLQSHNAGLFAMRGDFFLEFSQFISSVVTPMKSIPQGIEQILLNYWVHQHTGSLISNNSLCLNLSNRFVLDSSIPSEKKPVDYGTIMDGRFVNQFGGEFPIIHANGDQKQILEQWRPNP